MPISHGKMEHFQMRARARDSSNNITTVSINFSVSGSSNTGSADTTPPQTFIYNPINGSNQGPYSFHLSERPL